MLEFITTHRVLLTYISIPVTCGFVGWMTNYIALKMTFYPLKFWGIPPYLGWQGIIPRKAYKMASKAVDMLTTKLIRVDELFENVSSEEMAKKMAPPIKKVTDDLVEDVGQSSNPQVWDLVPEPVKDGIRSQVNNEISPLIAQVLDNIKSNIFEYFDLKNLVIKNLTGNNVKRLNELFMRCGSAEFKFIEMSGLYFGFSLGLIQMGIWYFFAEAWTLPIFGIIVGYATNWLALKMIFRPLREKKYLFFKYQGLFLKRQKEVSKEYADLVANSILTPDKILDSILYGKTADALFDSIQTKIFDALNRIEGLAKPVVTVLVGSAEYEAIRRYIATRILDTVPHSVHQVEKYLGESMGIEKMLYERMVALEPEDFEVLLRTAFQEDEIILILVGAFLGFMVGVGQAFLVTL